jgi:hypothetical protein
MTHKNAQKKTIAPIPVIVAIISLVGVCITVIGGIVTGIIPEIINSLLAQPSENAITFRVTEVSGASIPQAKVVLVSGASVLTGYTDNNGVATFAIESSSDKRVFVETSQYEIYDQVLPKGDNSLVEIRLSPKDVNRRNVIIRVFDSEQNIPIDGAEVVLIANGNVYSQPSDSNGITKFYMAFQTDEIDSDISVGFNGYKIEHQRVTLQADRVQDIRLDKTNGTISVGEIGQTPQQTVQSSSPTPLASIPIDVPGAPITLGTSITSTIDKDTKPRDVFAVNLSAGQTLRVDVTSTQDITVYLHKVGAVSVDNSYYLTLCDYTKSCTNTFLIPVSGTYYINVRARASGLQYTLKVDAENTLQPPQIANNIPGTPLQIGNSITSVLDSEIKPREVFAVDLQAGQTVRVTTSSTQDITVYLHKVGAVSIDNSYYVTLCDYTKACTNAFLIPVSGTYYINVRARASGLQYTLKVDAENTLQPPQVANNIPGTSLQIGNSITSVLDSEIKPREVFAVDLQAGQTVRVTTSSTQDITVYLHKVGATAIDNSYYVTLCDYTKSCTNTFLIPVSGTYYLNVRARASGLQYTLKFDAENTLQPPQVANNIPGTPLQIGSLITSVLDSEIKQRDIFAVDLVAGQTLRVNISSTKNVTIYIHKVGTISLDNSDYETLCDYTTGCTNVFLVPVSGTYYLQIRAREGGLQYTLSTAIE